MNDIADSQRDIAEPLQFIIHFGFIATVPWRCAMNS